MTSHIPDKGQVMVYYSGIYTKPWPKERININCRTIRMLNPKIAFSLRVIEFFDLPFVVNFL